MKVQECITEVMKTVRAVGKDSTNTQQHFNFRGIDAVVNALSPAMREVGLSVRPSGILSITHEPFQSKSGTSGTAVNVIVEYTFTGPDGDELKSVVAAEANDYGDKATPKAMSVAFRTCLLQAFALPTDETDPDAQSYDRGEERFMAGRVQGDFSNARVQGIPPATEKQKQWLDGKIAELDDSERDELLEQWQRRVLPGIMELNATEAAVARDLVIAALEKHNASSLPEQYTDTPMALSNEVPAGGREALNKLQDYSNTGRRGIPQPGFMGRGPNGESPWFEGADNA
jgi:hypothetical protein